MTTNFSRFSLFVLLFFLTANIILMAQVQENTQNQVSVFIDINLDSEESNRLYTTIINKTAIIELGNRGLVPVPAGDPKRFVSAEELKSFYESQQKLSSSLMDEVESGNYIMIIHYYLEQSLFIIEVHVWDNNGDKILKYEKQERSGLAIYNRLNQAASEFVNSIGTVLEGEATADTTTGISRVTAIEIPKDYTEEIILFSVDEGAEIYLNGKEKLGEINNGQFIFPFIPFDLGTTITIEKRKKEYYTDTEEFLLDSPKMKIELRPLARKSRFSGNILWTTGQLKGLGIGFNYFLTPDSFFIGAEDYLFFQTGNSDNSGLLLHNDIRCLLGFPIYYEPQSFFSFGISTGLGAILTISTIPGMPLYTDFYFNVINFLFEFRFGNYSVFIREELKHSLGLGPNLLGSRWLFMYEGMPLFTLGVMIRW